MKELVGEREACREYCAKYGIPFMVDSKVAMQAVEADGAAQEDASASPTLTRNEGHLLKEISHLQLDLGHYQKKAEHLQVEERQRQHEIARLCGELSEAYEHLEYERQCVRHHEVCRQFG